MKVKLIDNGFEQHAKILKRHVTDRIRAEFGDKGMQIQLFINSSIGTEESYQIVAKECEYCIVGADEAGLFYGIGKFLHSAIWSDEDFIPNPPVGVITPACSYRCIYFSTHLYNWYQMAPEDELEKYLEEMLLWGYNTIHLIIPVLNLYSFEDKLYCEMVEKTRAIFKLAKKFGMKTSLGFNPNQGLLSAPKELYADPSYDLTGQFRGWLGKNVCPSKPGTIEYLSVIWKKILEQYTDIGIDYVMMWPYDEGGCGCKDCRPWGAKGYCDVSIQCREEVLKYYPHAKFIVSTWTFDVPNDQGEYEGFYERLKGDMAWVDYIMVDAHGEYPRYPLEHEVVKPIVNFPEISMWKLYPWGGFGANPMPERFQKIWDSSKKILRGGMPYSEGMYEDILKIQCVGYYWEPDRHWRDILGEYFNYECCREISDDALDMIAAIEVNHVKVGMECEPDIAEAVKATTLAKAIDAQLPERAKTSWRWRILYIRAVLDEKRYSYYQEHHMQGKKDLYELRHYSGDFLVDDEEAQLLFAELRQYYHSVEENGQNRWTLPPLNGGVRAAELREEANKNRKERVNDDKQ